MMSTARTRRRTAGMASSVSAPEIHSYRQVSRGPPVTLPELTLVPSNRSSQTFTKIGACPEAELLLGTTGVQAAARLAVGLRLVPADIAPGAAQGADGFPQ